MRELSDDQQIGFCKWSNFRNVSLFPAQSLELFAKGIYSVKILRSCPTELLMTLGIGEQIALPNYQQTDDLTNWLKDTLGGLLLKFFDLTHLF